MLGWALIINAACVGWIAVDALVYRDLRDQSIGAGGWIFLTVLLGPVALALYLAARSRAPRRR